MLCGGETHEKQDKHTISKRPYPFQGKRVKEPFRQPGKYVSFIARSDNKNRMQFFFSSIFQISISNLLYSLHQFCFLRLMAQLHFASPYTLIVPVKAEMEKAGV